MKMLAASLVLLCAAVPASARAEGRVWLEVSRPYNGWVELGLNSLVEVRGAAGSVGRGVLDIVIILDVSRSTGNGSGADVNRDGHLGGIGWRHRRSVRSFLRHPQRSSDPDDSILHAETEAVRQLLDRLDLSRTRLGIVTLRDRAQVRASIGSDREQLLAALDTLEREAPQGRTHMAEAIRVATQALEDARPPGRIERALGIILLSDGRPTVPAPDQRAADEAVRAAKQAYRRGVHIHSVALGSSKSESRALVEIAQVSRGAFTALAEPGEIIAKLPHLDLSGLADVSVLNQTNGKRARALRVWADGSFDGFVELQPGKNVLLIRANGPDGSRAREQRFVYYKKRPPRTERERRLEVEKLERLRDFLRDRSVEVQLAREGETRPGERDLTIEPESD